MDDQGDRLRVVNPRRIDAIGNQIAIGTHDIRKAFEQRRRPREGVSGRNIIIIEESDQIAGAEHFDHAAIALRGQSPGTLHDAHIIWHVGR